MDMRLGHILDSTFLIKRSSFLRQVFFFFPSYFNRKYFFILDPTQVTQEIQAFSCGANMWDHLAHGEATRGPEPVSQTGPSLPTAQVRAKLPGSWRDWSW